MLAFCLVFVHSVPLVQLLQGVVSAVDVRCACTVLASAQAFRVLVVQASGIVIISHSRVGCLCPAVSVACGPFLRAAALI